MTQKKVGVNLNVLMIEKWIKQSDKWEEENKKKKHIRTPERKAFYPKAEKILY
ncbi:2114_t:CDS:2, partial [Rhizophagus irregularis]